MKTALTVLTLVTAVAAYHIMVRKNRLIGQ